MQTIPSYRDTLEAIAAGEGDDESGVAVERQVRRRADSLQPGDRVETLDGAGVVVAVRWVGPQSHGVGYLIWEDGEGSPHILHLHKHDQVRAC